MGINREIRYETAGNSTGVSQVFYNNYLADSRPVQTNFFSFEKPMFYTYGGTLDYYGQDPYSIYTNLVRPPIRFVFSANTFSLSGDSYFVHEIYKLDYSVHKLFSDNQIDIKVDMVNKSESNDISLSGNPPKEEAPSRSKLSNENLKSGNNVVPMPEKFFGAPLTANDKATIQNYFSNPVLIITASTSAITGNIYDLYIDQYIKQSGDYKIELFSDKAQYFSFLAYLFEEYAPEKLDLIFNLYFMACFRDKNNFPKISFFKFINKLTTEQVQSLLDSLTLDTVK